MKRPGIQDIGLGVCFLLLAVIAFRPSGVLGSRLRAWNAERQVLALYRAEWEGGRFRPEKYARERRRAP